MVSRRRRRVHWCGVAPGCGHGGHQPEWADAGQARCAAVARLRAEQAVGAADPGDADVGRLLDARAGIPWGRCGVLLAYSPNALRIGCKTGAPTCRSRSAQRRVTPVPHASTTASRPPQTRTRRAADAAVSGRFIGGLRADKRGAERPRIRFPAEPSRQVHCARVLASTAKDWSEREDLNFRPPAPHAGALPGCATLRP